MSERGGRLGADHRRPGVSGHEQMFGKVSREPGETPSTSTWPPSRRNSRRSCFSTGTRRSQMRSCSRTTRRSQLTWRASSPGVASGKTLPTDPGRSGGTSGSPIRRRRSASARWPCCLSPISSLTGRLPGGLVRSRTRRSRRRCTRTGSSGMDQVGVFDRIHTRGRSTRISASPR